MRRFVEATVARDLDAVASMLRDDVRCSMPPTPGPRVGRDAVLADWTQDGFPRLAGLRAVPTAVNRQPAIAFYLWQKRASAHPRLTVDVLRISRGAISEITTFHADPVPAARPAGAVS